MSWSPSPIRRPRLRAFRQRGGPLSLGRRQTVHRPCEAVKRRKPTTINQKQRGRVWAGRGCYWLSDLRFCSRRTLPYKEGSLVRAQQRPQVFPQVESCLRESARSRQADEKAEESVRNPSPAARPRFYRCRQGSENLATTAGRWRFRKVLKCASRARIPPAKWCCEQDHGDRVSPLISGSSRALRSSSTAYAGKTGSATC